MILNTAYLTNLYIILNIFVIRPMASSEKLELGSFQRCIKGCICDTDDLKRKRVICESGGLKAIPISRIDPSTKVLIVDGKPNQENNLNLGKIFYPLKHLEEVKISHSRLPAIGESSFWPGTELKLLDLSHNNIGILSSRDFYNLSVLEQLDLSDNRLSDHNIPSAPFEFLISLEQLSLAQNGFKRIVPRMFYSLKNLQRLDLSYNQLVEIKADDFTDLPGLRSLSLQGCGLKDVPVSVYRTLSDLHELDLRYNKLSFLTSFGFKDLENLGILRLDGNKLTVLSDHTFDSLKLTHLGLSANSLGALSSCTFCSSTIKSLDLSSNQIRGIVDNLLDPIKHSLLTLNFNDNPSLINPGSSVSHLIKPLRKIRHLSLAATRLDDSLPPTTFTNSTSLLSLDLSQNSLSNLSTLLFQPLKHLEVLNLSHNSLSTLDSSVLSAFDSISSLRVIALHSNPWSCYRCHILPLIEWLNSSPPAYFNLCTQQGHNPGKYCLKCTQPSHLEGRDVHLIRDEDIEYCQYTKIQMRLTYPQPKIGMVLGVLMVISFTFLVIIIALIYRRQGAVYYTHEKDAAAAAAALGLSDDLDEIDIDSKSQLTKDSVSIGIQHSQAKSPTTITDNFIAINPSTIPSYTTYTSFEPRLRY